MFQQRQTTHTNRLHRAVDYTPRTEDILQILKNHWHILSDTLGCELFPCVGFRKTSSIRDLLVKAEFTSKPHIAATSPKGHFKCGQCSICPLAIETKYVDFPGKRFRHELLGFTNCKTCMCVYMLTCVCVLQYIGSTKHELRVRIQEHQSRIKHSVLKAPLVQHFWDKNHKFNYFNFVVLEKGSMQPCEHKDLYRLLLQQETFWISKLNTVMPNGLNLEVDYSVFL